MKLNFLKRKIYLFGDSHIQIFEYIENNLNSFKFLFKTLKIGGATALGLVNPRSKTDALGKFNEVIIKISKKKRLLFLLGEVDCGFVIWYRASKYKLSVKAQFEESLKNYQSFLLSLKAKGYKYIGVVSSILPTIFDDSVGDVVNLRKDVTASIDERTELTLNYNDRMEIFCKNEGFLFIDIVSELIDARTNVVNRLYLNEIKTDHHLNNKKVAPLVLDKINRINFRKWEYLSEKKRRK